MYTRSRSKRTKESEKEVENDRETMASVEEGANFDDEGSFKDSSGSKPNSMSEWGIKLRLKELELEEKRIAAEERRAQLEAEERRAELEADERRFQIEAETQRAIELSKIELEAKRIEADREIALRSGQGSPSNGLLAANEDGSAPFNLEERNLKRWSTVLKAIAPSVPENAADFPLFFRGVENIFENQGVPQQYRGRLLTPLLGGKMRNLVARLTPDQLNDYDVVKTGILEEFKLSASEYKK